jgi:UDP-N-acetylmuramoyl-tripeptide--D-alanyl-D-alanine ligase
MNLRLNDILKINFNEIYIPDKRKVLSFKGISIDSRSLMKGQIYIAIRGEKNDGHAFLHNAIKKGASAVVVDRKFFKAAQKQPGLIEGIISVPMIVVDDSVKALGELANIYRNKFHIPVIAVAGSNGKTTTKDIIAGVLSEKYNVLATEGNLNNQIGVPLTIFRMNKKHDIAVVEIGTNHFGEIEYLCKILEPTHGVITNIGNEHLQFLQNINGVTKEEGALFGYLAKGNVKKTAFVNADDKIILGMSRKLKHKVKYGIASRNSDVQASNGMANGSGKFKFEIHTKTKSEKFSVSLNVSGRHNMFNALTASAIGLNFGVPPKSIQKALHAFKPSGKRMEVITVGQVTVINDTYNANLDSMLFALETLKSIKSSGKKIIILADMLELGRVSQKHHTMVGNAINNLSKEEKQQIILMTFGKMAQYIYRTAKVVEKFYYKDKSLLKKKLQNIVSENDVVLVKGSRGMKMEEVVESLIKKLRG